MEEWRDVWVCNSNTYQISSLGNLRNKRFPDRLLKPYLHKKTGYYFYRFGHLQHSKEKEAFTQSIHRMVAVAFLDNADIVNNLCVDHIDGNRLNNTTQNLEWVSSKENNRRARERKMKKTE
jgi:hypothetical protein